MDNSIYEVERDEYVGFIGQLNKEMMDVEKYFQDDTIITKIKSKNNNVHLCTQVISPDDVHYFIFNMPTDEERIDPKGVMKVTLNTKEDVQAFFDALNKLQLEAKKDAGNI